SWRRRRGPGARGAARTWRVARASEPRTGPGRGEDVRAARTRRGSRSRHRTVHDGGPRLQTWAAMLTPTLVTRLRAVVGADGVIDRREALLVYECDGYTLERAAPAVRVLPP